MNEPTRVIPLAPVPESDGITRRTALQGIAVSLGLTMTSPAEAEHGGAEPHPLAAHIVQRRAPAVQKAAAPFTPAFLDTHQFATLSIVADLIVPGAVASESPAYIDRVLAVESTAVRRAFVSALASLDASARDQHATTFRALTSGQQVAVLESSTKTLATLKSWVAGAHYSSEAGMKELGFTGAMFFTSFPACTHPDGHA